MGAIVSIVCTHARFNYYFNKILQIIARIQCQVNNLLIVLSVII